MNRLIPYLRAWALLALQLAGSVLAGFVLGRAVFPQPTSAAVAAPLYQESDPCPDCPATASPQSVEVQKRDGSVLFVLRGRWPASVDALPMSIRLLANDVEIVLKPHGSQGAFELVTATRGGAALPHGAVGAGLQPDALLIDVQDPALGAPIQFAVGLWDGARFHGALPRSGRLLWAGQGAPQPAPGGSPAPATTPAPQPTQSPAATPTPPPATPAPIPAVAAPVDLLAFAGGCGPGSTGTVPPYLEIASVRGGRGADPRSGAQTPFVDVTLAAPVPGVVTPFTVTIAIQPAGQAPIPAPSGSRRPIDATGTVQLSFYWDGHGGEKGIRSRTVGGPWTMLQGQAADAMTVAFGSDGVTFYYAGLHTGDRVVAVTATAGGCRLSGLTR